MARSTYFDSDSADSFLAFFRRRRAVLVRSMIADIFQAKGRCHIIDLGGEEAYWHHIGIDFLYEHGCVITLLNTTERPVSCTLFESVAGDACAVAREDNAFDLVHSNSVIEHVGGWSRMMAFAHEVKRLAPHFYVQTPNFYFPLEPHFRTPFFQFLPRRLRVALLRTFQLGYFARTPDYHEAALAIDSCQLITPTEVAHLFGKPAVRFERFLGLNKSIIAVQ